MSNPDPLAAARAWHERHRAIQVNHLVAVKESLTRLLSRRFTVDELLDDVTRSLAATA